MSLLKIEMLQLTQITIHTSSILKYQRNSRMSEKSSIELRRTDGGNKSKVNGLMDKKNNPGDAGKKNNNEKLREFLNTPPQYKINRSCSYYRKRSSFGRIVVASDLPHLKSAPMDRPIDNRNERIRSLPTPMPASKDMPEEVVRQFTLTHSGLLKNMGDTRRKSVRKASIIPSAVNDTLIDKIDTETIETGDGIVKEINVHHVCIVGMLGTGKRSILKQFRCSEYNGIYRFDNPPGKIFVRQTFRPYKNYI
ncbi:hypothetical protein ACOME3_002693 [Neoechinorhynchus agilis]